MPYFAPGYLEFQAQGEALSRAEVVELLYQTLNALQYLHMRRVAHRDLKPENILVATRHPLSVKLADIGLADDKTYLETFCGTMVYIAPEISPGDGQYTTAVDVWSLGVIGLKYAHGLPEKGPSARASRRGDWGYDWCSRIIGRANSLGSNDELLNLIRKAMLLRDPAQRFSAEACLRTGLHGQK